MALFLLFLLRVFSLWLFFIGSGSSSSSSPSSAPLRVFRNSEIPVPAACPLRIGCASVDFISVISISKGSSMLSTHFSTSVKSSTVLKSRTVSGFFRQLLDSGSVSRSFRRLLGSISFFSGFSSVSRTSPPNLLRNLPRDLLALEKAHVELQVPVPLSDPHTGGGGTGTGSAGRAVGSILSFCI